MSIFIKNIQLNGLVTHIKIEGNRFSKIRTDATPSTSDTIIDGTDKAILPPFYNTHTHSPMSLLRGYADDLPLFTWLNDYIWPFEAKLTPDDIYIGTRLSILEMIKSGTVFFNDMYWKEEATIRAAKEMGIRAAIGIFAIDSLGLKDIDQKSSGANKQLSDAPLIQMTISPHAIYSTNKTEFQRCAEVAKEHNWVLHTHVSETKKEVDDCLKEHGCTPIELLEKYGVLDCPKVILAHAVHITENDMEIISKHGSVISHNPISNMKLSSGYFPIQAALDKGCKITLGTDGCSSNNNQDMREEMKFASIRAKEKYGAESIPVSTIFEMATKNGAEAFGLDAGEIKEGKLADALLIDLNNERMVPCHHLLSNWVYAANSECIDTVICNGRILMQNRHVDGEEEIIQSVKKRYK